MDNFGKYSEENLAALAKAKEAGKTIAGLYCAFAPHELVMAAGAIPIGLCSTRLEPIGAAERVLPTSLCPLIKSSYGAAITGSCPYFKASDFIIAETTCEGKKKMFELLGEWKPIILLELPQRTDGTYALEWWVSELRRCQAWLEERMGVKVTEEALRDTIRTMNRERRLLQRLYSFYHEDKVPLSGVSMHTALLGQVSPVDHQAYATALENLISHLEERVELGLYANTEAQPRILITGCPTGNGSDKVLRLVEECGGIIVGQESCNGIKTASILVDEEKEPLVALAERHLSIGCAVRTPNRARFDLIDRLVVQHKVDGVVDLTWQGCHSYNIESYSLRRHLQERHGIPTLQVVTDYSESDTEQLRTRIAALMELLDSRRESLSPVSL
ncbi:MAG: double-cubane-cluster-containing anaerobic reductase [Dehalococcoidia bacterium]|nr:double-cubane-cluster-containing anaerobic reductase [Dehalococcoidia bacterium]